MSEEERGTGAGRAGGGLGGRGEVGGLEGCGLRTLGPDSGAQGRPPVAASGRTDLGAGQESGA